MSSEERLEITKESLQVLEAALEVLTIIEEHSPNS